MKNIIAGSFVIFVFLHLAASPLYAGGALIRLKRLGDNIALQEKILKQEQKRYDKAAVFIDSDEINKGISSGLVLARCGEPVAKVRGGREWVYKPPTSSFFEGEKIYFIFGEDERLIGWKKVSQ